VSDQSRYELDECNRLIARAEESLAIYECKVVAARYAVEQSAMKVAKMIARNRELPADMVWRKPVVICSECLASFEPMDIELQCEESRYYFFVCPYCTRQNTIVDVRENLP
jgi:hypothetical protein